MDGDQLILVLVQNVEILTYGSRGPLEGGQIVYGIHRGLNLQENPVTGWIRGIGVKVIVPVEVPIGPIVQFTRAGGQGRAVFVQ